MEPSWLAVALEITGGFESSGDPFTALAGDFDGMGLSAGALQWNIGQGTLQPLIQAGGEALVRRSMPHYGADFWRACHLPPADALGLIRSWQGRKRRLPPILKAELAALMGSEAMRTRQIGAAEKIGRRAEHLAESWAASLGRAISLRDFCWFFDLVTQNGGMKGVTIGDVRAFLAGEPDPLRTITAWLAASDNADARRNAALWRQERPGELLVLSYLRARKARPAFAAAVMNRKGTIAMSEGWVNGTRRDLAARFKGTSTAAA